MYDSIIVGGGPAGLTAGIYLARAGFKTLILEKEGIGGQIASSPVVENYPGFTTISGSDLANNMYEQAISYGVDIEVENVIDIVLTPKKKVKTDYNEYECKTVIIATGSKYRKLGLSTENKFMGDSIHYCVSCDGFFYKDKTVAVIGGGNTAVINALYLADIAKKVYLVEICDELKCEKQNEEKLRSKSNVEIHLESSVEKFIGEDKLESIEINTKGEIKNIKVDGVFESIGMAAQTELTSRLLDRNEYDYIISDDCKTKIDGIFVAGDCRTKDIRQLTTATSDGTIAANLAIKYMR